MNRIKQAFTFLILPLLILSCSSTKEIRKTPQFGYEEPVLSKSIKDTGTTAIPSSPTTRFSTQDTEVIASLKLKNLSGIHTLRCDWYEPSGSLYYSTGNRPLEVSEGKYRREVTAWNRLSIHGERAADHPGNWKVHIYLDKDFISSKSFRVTSVGTAVDVRKGIRWAVVIGISRYQDTRIPTLRYASDDAKSFYTWLISPDGGKYAPTNVRLLLDSDGSFRNIRDALFIWLKQALEEDVVTIYFAGHGSPDSPDAPENLFLLPYDAHYDSIATTGFPMWDIETALKRFIKAKKVVVIADACHAGGVGQSFDIARRANRAIKVNPISTGLQSLSKAADGVCIISASDDKQFSQEGEKWGGGHGVFTHFLLKGLKGDANYNKDNCVALGELISYVSEQVRRATRNAQSPVVAGKYDPALCTNR